MEESERPSKIRKLSHEAKSVLPPNPTRVDALNNETQAVNESALSAEPKPSDGSTAAQTEQSHSESVEKSAIASISEHVDGAQAPLSKNQLKKLRKKEAWEAGRDDRKLKRKEKDRERKARKRVAIQDAIANGREHEVSKIQHPDRRPRPIRRMTLPVAFMLDCGFDEFMLERESISLGTQVTRSYSEYMKSPYQPHLVVSGWTKENENRKRFEGLLKGMYKNWTGIVFTEEDFIGASLIAEKNMRGTRGGRMVAAFEKYALPRSDTHQVEHQNGDVRVEGVSTNGEVKTGGATDHSMRSRKTETSNAAAEHLETLQRQGEIIYLTSDSPDTLTELKPYHTYIIGGIVDKNRHKGLCYKRALDANSNAEKIERLNGRQVKTAKLPIGEYMQMASRQVLATNHVVEIMLRWLDCRDWGQAFLEVMPKRKGAKLRDESNNAADTPEEFEHDDDPEDLQAGNDAELAAHASLNTEEISPLEAEAGDNVVS